MACRRRTAPALTGLLILSSALPAGAAAPAPVPMSIEDAIRTAFANNKRIQIQEKEIRAAKAARLGAVSAFLPKVNVDGGYTRNDAVLGEAVPLAGETEKDIGLFTGYENDIRAGASVDQPIYTGGANLAALRKAQIGIRVQEETLRATRLDVELDAKRLYYGLLLAAENERIARNLVAQARSHYENVRDKYAHGTASRFDLLQSKIHVSLLVPQLVQARNAIDLTEADLKKLLSLPMRAAILPRDALLHVPVRIDEESFLRTALERQPEVILRTLGVDMGEWSVRQARAGRLPQVAANLRYETAADSAGDLLASRHSLWRAGVSVTVPIFDGFYTKSKVDEAWARYAQAGLEREDVLERVAVEVRRACLDLRQAQAIVDSQRDNIVEATEALRLSEVRFDNGVGTNLDVIDAFVSLSQAEQYLAGGIYDYIMAKSYLHRTMGESVLTEE
ncbi:MAG: TolC family protein [bacterium]|nr:TolC family protein [bacterium]